MMERAIVKNNRLFPITVLNIWLCIIRIFRYYNSVQSLPKLSNSEMAEYLRETTQVCAESMSKDDVEAKPNNDDPDPALMVTTTHSDTVDCLQCAVNVKK